MSKEYRRVSVFIDTNQLQSFISGEQKINVFLSALGIPRFYYDLVNFIESNRLEHFVEICISEVVIRELRQHMLNAFNQYCDTLDTTIAKYRKAGGDIVEINYTMKYSKQDYPTFVDGLINDFVENPKNKCRVIPLPHSKTILETLFDKSLRGVKPFTNQAISGKTFKDGGFKDAVIAESIYSYCSEAGTIGLLISDDGDFGQKFNSTLNNDSEYVKCSSIEQAVLFLQKYYETSPEDRLTREFTENAYWHEVLLNDVGQEYDAAVTHVEVEHIAKTDDNQYEIDILITVNEAIYSFTIVFDVIANDIIETRYSIDND